MPYGYAQAFFNPTQFTGFTGDIAPNLTAAPGELQPYNGNFYQYVKFDNGVGDVAAVAGRACYWKDRANWVVTSDISDSQGGGTELCLVAGLFLYAMTDGRWGWIFKRGLNTQTYVSGAGAVGQILVPSTTDGQLTTVATGAVSAAQAGAQQVGRQLTVAVANVCTALIQILD